MAADELVSELKDDILRCESAFFGGDLGVKNHLEQDIAQFFFSFFGSPSSKASISS